MELPAAHAQSSSPARSWSTGSGWHEPHTASPSPAPNNTVILELPASSAYLSILRTATAGLAALLQFTLDEIEDLRIAVDEACAVLLASHPAATTTRVGEPLTSETVLTCKFTLHTQYIEVEVTLPMITDPERIAPSQHSFAWQVLRALTDDVETYADATTLGIRLAKRRAAA